mgnify:CR=1 FL=1
MTPTPLKDSLPSLPYRIVRWSILAIVFYIFHINFLNFTTTKNAEGQGGNVYLKLFMSKNGKPCCSVFDPNSEAAKQKRAERKQKAESSDLPF